MSNLYLQQKGTYVPSARKKSGLFIRFALIATLIGTAATMQGCSRKTIPTPDPVVLNPAPADITKTGIIAYSLPGTVQIGETAFGFDNGTYYLTVNLKQNVNISSVTPYIYLQPGATMATAPATIDLTKEIAYKVTLASGEVQNWKINVIHAENNYKDKIFKQNDKIIFVGNSITHSGRYHSYIYLYYMTRFPNYPITILNGGIAGDMASNINFRLNEDVYAKKPSVINLTFGMNDSGFFQYLFTDPVKTTNKLLFACDSTFNLIRASMNAHTDIRKIMMTSSPYDLTTKADKDGGWMEKPNTFDHIVAMQMRDAATDHWTLYDIYHPMDVLNKTYQKTNPYFTLAGTADRVHPESDGHLTWAYFYLRYQGLKGFDVADVAVDASAKKVMLANNCDVKNLATDANSVSFDYLAYSLPFPVDTVYHNGDTKNAAKALTYVPFMSDLNQELLVVKNLQGNDYDLKIDGIRMGRFKAADLGSGINLAEIHATPQYKQALNIMNLNEQRFSTEHELRDYFLQVFDYARPNGITNDNDPASWAKMEELKKTNLWMDLDLYKRDSDPAVRQTIQAKIDQLTAQIYSSNKPTSHKIELVKAD